MEQDGWEKRLLALIEADGRTWRAISLAAGLGPNYVQQLHDRKTVPKLDAAEKLCETLNTSLIYVLTGVPLDREGEELIRLAGTVDQTVRHHLIQILRGGPSPAGNVGLDRGLPALPSPKLLQSD